MFTYKIRNHKGQPDASSSDASTSMRKQTLKRNLEKTWMNVGDRVKFKKPKKGAIYATIFEIIEDPDKITWSHGGVCPMNIVVDVEKVDKANGVVYGTERVKTNIKKLSFVSKGDY